MKPQAQPKKPEKDKRKRDRRAHQSTPRPIWPSDQRRGLPVENLRTRCSEGMVARGYEKQPSPQSQWGKKKKKKPGLLHRTNQAQFPNPQAFVRRAFWQSSDWSCCNKFQQAAWIETLQADLGVTNGIFVCKQLVLKVHGFRVPLGKQQ